MLQEQCLPDSIIQVISVTLHTQSIPAILTPLVPLIQMSMVGQTWSASLRYTPPGGLL